VGISYVDMLEQCSEEAMLRKVPEVRVVGVPRPSKQLTPETIAKDMVPGIIEALTEPLTDKEKYAGMVTPPPPDRIALTGTYDEVQDFFIGDLNAFQEIEPHCKWTDGLPIVPPTSERVAAMLEGTTPDPAEEFEVINYEADVGWKPLPLGLRYNVEKVAINAVMAGCRPEMMPICLAIAETHPGRFITTTPSSDFGVVSGPIAQQVGMSSKRNAMMPGNLANQALGRFMVLFRHNIAKFIPGKTMQHTQGSPINKGLVFAENHEGSPWTNLSEEHGFSRDESTYTRYHTKGLWDFGLTLYGAHFSRAYSFKAKHQPPKGDVLHYAMKLMKASGMPKYFILILGPDDAQRMAAQEGFETKDDVRKWLYENATMTFGEYRDGEAWPPHDYVRFPKGDPRFEDSINQLADLGITEDQVTRETPIHLPLFGPQYFHIVHMGSGTPLPTLVRGTHCMTVSIDKWR
jgi:hypothetical protein